MILAVDIGNTMTHAAVFQGNKIITLKKFPTASKFIKKFTSSFGAKYKKNIAQVGIASVVTKEYSQWKDLVEELFSVKPIFINHNLLLPVNLRLKNPVKIGADRICNAVAAYEFFRKKENVIAADFGTAVTYDIVLKNGDYIGGIISPGVETMAKSLYRFTSKLPMLKRNEMYIPRNIIGKNTVEALRAGTAFASVASFEGIVAKIEKDLKRKFKVILSGGFARQIHAKTAVKTVIRENLVLEGINCILKYNNAN